ncbi:MAG: protein kinase [Planctomycetota bacterium]|nr:protein kinase [Planctomycetota bacterium]
MAGAYQIGEFVLESKLGEGGMGVVFRARQVALDRWVALKLLAKPATGGSTFYERFHREARSAAQLVHPNIIQIYTIGEHKGAPYYAMEYVEGEDLARVLKNTGRLSIDETVEVTRGVAKALALAGDAGIVHRDVKPANVMVTVGGLVKVMDFGLAKATASEHTLTQEGQIMGTPTYLSPEQGMSKEVDARSDLYSLGCVMYECLTGNPPFQGDNLPSLIFKHLYEPVKPMREADPNIPEALEQVCMKLLAKKAEERYQSGMELLEALAMVTTNQAMAEITMAKRVRQVKSERNAAQPAQDAEAAKMEATAAVEATTNPLAQPPPAEPNMNLTPLEDSPPKTKVLPPRETKSHLVFEAAPPPPRGAAAGVPPPPPPPPLSALDETARPPGARSGKRPVVFEVPEPAPETVEPETQEIVVPRSPGSSSKLRAADVPPPPPSARMRAEDAPSGFTARPASGAFMRPGSGALIRRSNVSTYFLKNADGRWSYDTAQGHCKYAEGMAAESLPGGELQVGKLGDCLLCSNWNRRSGCAIATAQYIESTSRAKGVDLLEEVAAVWCVTGRFDKGIALLEEHIRSHPEDPDGYRALARIYERPDYSGKDKPRSLILYGRFVELASRQGGYSNIEVERAQARLTQLQAAAQRPPEPQREKAFSGTMLHTFPCFYRSNGTVFFGLGGVNRDSVVVARAGEVDPDTGVSASEMGNPFLLRATTLIRRIKSEKAKAEEREQVKKEIERISKTSVDMLLRESGKCHTIPLSEIQAIEYSKDESTDQRMVKLRMGRDMHELIFSAAADMEADRCALMIRRLTGK